MAADVALRSPPAGAGRAALVLGVSLLVHVLIVAGLREGLVEPLPAPLARAVAIDVALIREAPPDASKADTTPTRALAPTARGTSPSRDPKPMPRHTRPTRADEPLGAAALPPPGSEGTAPGASTAAAEPADRATVAARAAGLAMELAELGGGLVAFPPSGSYEYRTSDSRRRETTGTTKVDWRVDPATRRYEAHLRSELGGATTIDLSSAGSVQRFGLAPDRYVQKSGRRAPQAANVDWEQRRVTFSARTGERAANEGLQDRLSFQFQLMAFAQQLPSSLRTGGEIAMEVAGPGDVDLYRFLVVGRETLDTGAGPVETVKLDRARERAGDSRVEVWLAPARRYLPVRLRFTDPRGNVTENVLESAREGP